MTVRQALLERLRHLSKTARMWRSPHELEAVGLHLAHAAALAAEPGRTLDATRAAFGGPWARDDLARRRLTLAMWGAQEAVALTQVLAGSASLWAGLAREPAREAVVGPWLEALLDRPALVGAPDCTNAVLFALMGFVAADPQAYAEQVARERERIGGDRLRPFHVVAPAGPTEVHLAYTANFTSWDAVKAAIDAAAIAQAAEADASPR